jgi:hypothetical protein
MAFVYVCYHYTRAPKNILLCCRFCQFIVLQPHDAMTTMLPHCSVPPLLRASGITKIKQDRIKLVLPLHQTLRLRSRTVPLLLQSIVVYCLLWLSLNWYPESDSNRHFTVSKTADSTRLAYRGIIWCNLEESNLFQRDFNPPLWPHQLKLHYTWSPMKDSNLRFPRSKQGGIAASPMRDKNYLGWKGESNPRLLFHRQQCYHYTTNTIDW